MENSEKNSHFQEAKLHIPFFGKPIGLISILLISALLFVVVYIDVLDDTIYEFIIIMILVTGLPFMFAGSICINISFLVKQSHFNKLKAKHDISWQVPTEKWIKLFELNEKQKKAKPMRKLILTSFFVTLEGAAYFYFPDFTLYDLLILLAFTFMITFFVALLPRWNAKYFLNRAKKVNSCIYINKKWIYLNGNLHPLSLISAFAIRIVREPIPYIEMAMFENIPLPENETEVKKISTLLGLKTPESE